MAILVGNEPLLVFKLKVVQLLHTHTHVGACLNNEKVVTSAWVVNNTFFSTPKHTRIADYEQPWRPHGQPAYQLARQ